MVDLPLKHLDKQDLEHVFRHTGGLWEEMRNKSILITGGTGFIGKWLTETFLYANRKLELNAGVWILTRNSERFRQHHPDLANGTSVHLVEGDISTFTLPKVSFSHIVHSAIDYKEDAIELFDSAVSGTRHVLDIAKQEKNCKFLYLSSGAVYGRQPVDLSHIPEDYPGAPDPLDPASAYGIGKRGSEFLCHEASIHDPIAVKIARCFAFSGPYLRLGPQSAIGSFIGDAIAHQPITLQGDGTPLRSYLYASDLAIWLWTILFRGTNEKAYNVGSEDAVSIAELAKEVTGVMNPSLEIKILQQQDPGRLPSRYIPSTALAREELGLHQRIQRVEGIRKMAAWYTDLQIHKR
jgi:nucleoside-diphosphate-sugar epimerase